MKRCPECRRDYYDDSLLYCLDDGSALVEGPNREMGRIATGSAADESATAILPGAKALSAGPAGIRPVAKAANSIAVLPFANLSSDPENDYFCDGLAEELMNALAKIGDLKVAARSSAFSFKGKNSSAGEIAAALNVRSILDGSVRKSSGRLRIAVHLVNALDGFDIWSESYDRKISDIFEIQEEIALSVVNALKVRLGLREKDAMLARPTESTEAYELYLKGRFHFAKRSEDDVRRGIELFREAIALDPKFALAYAGVADSLAVMSSFSYISPHEAMGQAKPAAAKALELDPESPEAHMAAGIIACTYDWDWEEGEQRFQHSIGLDPNLALARFRYAMVCLSPLGRHDEAIAQMKFAMQLEPLSVIQGAVFAAVLMYARRFKAALEQARKTYDLDPHHIAARHWIFHTLNANGMYAQALSMSESFLPPALVTLEQTGYAYAKIGRRQKAENIIRKLKRAEKTRYVTNYWIAVTYLALGKRAQALAELEKAYQAHDWFLPLLRTDPFLDDLSGDPRFEDLVRRIGLQR